LIKVETTKEDLSTKQKNNFIFSFFDTNSIFSYKKNIMKKKREDCVILIGG
jgi:hypothetical protein